MEALTWASLGAVSPPYLPLSLSTLRLLSPAHLRVFVKNLVFCVFAYLELLSSMYYLLL